MKKKVSKRKFNLKVLIICFAIVAVVAFLGSIFMGNSADSSWYQSIKPSITPPNYVFPIAWTTLFILIAISLYFAWTRANEKQKITVAILFAFSFFFNVIWTLFYFNLHNVGLALIDLLLLWISIIAIILVVRKISKASAYLLIPYLMWITFAGVLNYLSLR